MEAKAYTEVNYIINEMSEEMKNKIPKDIIENIKARMDKNYDFYIEDDDFENVELLEDTEKILSVLYTDYFATDEEKAIIKNKEKMIEEEKESGIENIKLNELFTRKQDKVIEHHDLTVVKKEKWYQKIKNILIKIFRRNND